MNEWLEHLPLVWGKIIAVITFAAMAVWAWFRPRSFIYQDAPDNRRWRDLRIWASIFMGIQVLIYLYFA